MTIQPIRSDGVSAPVGPYSAAVRCGDLIFLSGQAGQDPATGQLVSGGVEAEAEQVLRNLEAVLKSAGKTFDDVIKVGVFLTDMQDFPKVNAIYAKHFKAPFPARTTVEVAGLPLGAAIELDLIARA